MDNAMISVRLATGVKINGQRRSANEVIPVTPEQAQELARLGAISADDLGAVEIASGLPGFDEAVAETAKLIAEGAIDAAVERAMTEAARALAAMEARACEAEMHRKMLEDRVRDLQAEIEALKAPGLGDTAAPTPPKGAAVAGPVPSRKGAKPKG